MTTNDPDQSAPPPAPPPWGEDASSAEPGPLGDGNASSPSSASAEPERFVLWSPERAHAGVVLIALNVLWFLWAVVHGVSAVEPTAEDGLRFGANHGPAIAAGEWWRLVSAAFVHYGLLHLAMNAWAIWVLAPLAERLYGTGAFLLLYLFGAIGCSAASVLMKPETFSAGASGAVFAMIGGILVFFLLHRRAMPRGLFAGTMRWIGMLIGINLVLGLTSANIDNAGHFGGLAAGIVAGWCLDRDPRASPKLGAKRIGVALFLLILFAGVCAFIPGRVARSPRAGVSLALTRAEEAYQRQDWRAVEEHASEALEVAPDDVDALEMRALARAATGRADEALADCDHALRADPTTPEARRLRAVLRAARGEHDAARKDLERLVELLPSNARARTMLGQAQLALGKAKEAAVTLQAAIELDERASATAQLWSWMARTELGLRAQADKELARFEDGAFGQSLEGEDARAIELALRGSTPNVVGDEAELHAVIRALRALHPASGAPDPKAAREALDAAAAGGEPWVSAFARRIRGELAR